MNAVNTAFAVIGGAYGDEGKGLTVDTIADSVGEGVVVRTNGGAQAGHTVVTPDGRRHVFHHIGSGALAGRPTHWSGFAVAHPMFLLEEIKEVQALGGNAQISIDPMAAITTPFDILINQAVEIARGADRHGSCGMGFGETIERNLHLEFDIKARTLFAPDLRRRLTAIRDEWVPQRLAKLGVATPDPKIAEILADEATIENFIADSEAFLAFVDIFPDRRLLELGPVIFEGAQGLQLDQDYGAFPHVTRSNTGLVNMVEIAARAGIDRIDAVYATRAYTTRHGAGPMLREVDVLECFDVIDPTNKPNAWQGAIRYADLDLDHLRAAITFDVGRVADGRVNVNPMIAVGCLDQATAPFPIFAGNLMEKIEPPAAAAHIGKKLRLPVFGESWGPSRTSFHMN